MEFMFTPMHIPIPYRNHMVKICPTDFCRECISRIILKYSLVWLMYSRMNGAIAAPMAGVASCRYGGRR